MDCFVKIRMRHQLSDNVLQEQNRNSLEQLFDLCRKEKLEEFNSAMKRCK